MKFEGVNKLFYSALILVGVGIVYQKYQDKHNVESEENQYEMIKKYLLNEPSLGKMKKPVMWIHIPYEINSRHWEDFGSRNSKNLNEPYMYLTIKSIIEHCNNSFNICLIDDSTFNKLLPDWNINLNYVEDPIKNNLRKLGLMKLLYIYGGMVIPPSFICSKNLKSLYNEGTYNNVKPFACEIVSRNSTSTLVDFFPSNEMFGAPKKNKVIKDYITYSEKLLSKDATNESVFDGNLDRWLYMNIENNNINMITGEKIGTKTIDNKPIILEELFNKNVNFELSHNNYGVYLSNKELLSRHKFNWFINSSVDDLLTSELFVTKLLQKCVD